MLPSVIGNSSNQNSTSSSSSVSSSKNYTIPKVSILSRCTNRIRILLLSIPAVTRRVFLEHETPQFLKGFLTWQFLAGAIWLYVCAFWNCLIQVYVDKFQTNHYADKPRPEPLPDFGFWLLPNIEIEHLSDAWNFSMIGITAIIILLVHPWRVKIMKRFMVVQGCVFLLRSVTIFVTLLPNPYNLCESVSNDRENVVIEAVKVMLGMRYTCGDVLFSGHASNFTLIALIWNEYGHIWKITSQKGQGIISPSRENLPSEPQDSPIVRTEFPYSLFNYIKSIVENPKSLRRWIRTFWWTVAFFGYLVIIANRFHYTVDVVVGIAICWKQWSLYHLYARTPRLLARYPFLRWYECKPLILVEKYLNNQPKDDDRAQNNSMFSVTHNSINTRDIEIGKTTNLQKINSKLQSKPKECPIQQTSTSETRRLLLNTTNPLSEDNMSDDANSIENNTTPEEDVLENQPILEDGLDYETGSTFTNDEYELQEHTMDGESPVRKADSQAEQPLAE